MLLSIQRTSNGYEFPSTLSRSSDIFLYARIPNTESTSLIMFLLDALEIASDAGLIFDEPGHLGAE